MLIIPGVKDWTIDNIALPLLDGLFRDGTIYTYIQPTVDGVWGFNWHSINPDAGGAMDFIKHPHIEMKDHAFSKAVQDAVWTTLIWCCGIPLGFRGFGFYVPFINPDAPYH